MPSIILQIVMHASFIALLALVWRVSRRPRWRVRAVIYGWAATVLWVLFWALLAPMWFRRFINAETLHQIFPDGTLAAAFLFGGWFWPLIIVELARYRKKAAIRKSVDKHKT
jgi:multisubunit Na+/H+ antiporter MnhF subunit